ncbi:hypothetical protein T01_15991 [Trichinella spiralis]|uniref:Uncharacterized protein n=1 Tax=Trichinella spiralis TaxID=6334 RepID=A0A0V1BB14_TRISP|nr:hypothetical protein T01_15991 [Trichinella spiralis]
MEKIRWYFYPALMIRGSNAVSEQFSPLVLQSVRAMPVYRENLSRPNRKRKQHLRCKRGLGKILVQQSTHTGQQGFCGMASPFAISSNYTKRRVNRPPPPPPPTVEQFLQQ